MAVEKAALTKEQLAMARFLNLEPVARNAKLIDDMIALQQQEGAEPFHRKVAQMLTPPKRDDATELQRLYSGEAIVIPRNRDHAEKMLMIAEHWLKKNPA